MPHLLFFSLFIIISIFPFSIFGLTLNWRPRFPKYYKGNIFTCFETIVNLPLDYSIHKSSNPIASSSNPSPDTLNVNHATIPIFARSFRRGNPEKHVWILNGGPGGSSELYSKLMTIFESSTIFDNTWFYIMDQRGTGKSGDAICKPEECPKCLGDIKQCFANKNIHPREMNLTNASKDLISMVQATRKNHSGSSFFAISSGWGATVLYRALTMESNLFDRIIFEDFTPSIREINLDSSFKNATIDSNSNSNLDSNMNASFNDIGTYLIDSCLDDKWCNEQFSNNRQSLLSIIQRLEDPNRNKCTKSLRMHTEFFDLGSPSDLRPVIQYTIHAIMQSFGPLGSSPMIIIMSFLKHLDQCQNINAFNSLLLKIIKNIKKDSLLRMQGTGINDLIRVYDTFSELETVDFKTCLKKSINSFVNICTVQEKFVKDWKPVLQEYSYKSDISPSPTSLNNSISIEAESIIHYGDRFDPLTPFDPSQRFLSQIHSKAMSGNNGNGLVSFSPPLTINHAHGHDSMERELKACRPLLYHYLFTMTEDDKSKFQTCINSTVRTNGTYEKTLIDSIDRDKILWPQVEMPLWKQVGIICMIGIGIICISLLAVLMLEIYQKS